MCVLAPPQDSPIPSLLLPVTRVCPFRLCRMGLVGAAGFVRSNPRSDKFAVHDFAHIEVWCGDASTTWRRWAHGLGLRLVAKSDHSTGNSTYASYVCRCVV